MQAYNDAIQETIDLWGSVENATNATLVQTRLPTMMGAEGLNPAQAAKAVENALAEQERIQAEGKAYLLKVHPEMSAEDIEAVYQAMEDKAPPFLWIWENSLLFI
jgi:hypothetical protein